MVRVRAAFGTRRHRYLHRQLAELEDRTGGARLDRLEWGLGHAAPALWNDLKRAPLAPLDPPARLLERPWEDLETVIARMQPPQRAAIQAFGADALRRHADADSDPLPAPPDREHYGGENHLGYWLSGLADCLWLQQVAAAHGVSLEDAVLDFGCSSGRVLRHFAVQGVARARYGVDLQPQAVRWARRHLTGATVALSTVLPSLPLADRSLDLVYAGSVFTHIDDFEEATLLELRRVLKPSGVAVLTFHPGRTWAEMAADPEHRLRRIVTRTPHRLDPPGIEPITDDVFARPMDGGRAVFTATTYPVNNTNLIHTHDWVKSHWGQMFSVEEIVEHAHGEFQDAAVLRPR